MLPYDPGSKLVSEPKEVVMDKIKKILAPTDLSELSQAGVRYALNLARAVGAEVTVYHVIDTYELMHHDPLHALDHMLERSEAELGQFLKDHFSDLLPLLEVRKKVELGAPDANIVEAAKKDGVDLIVISTHGRTGLSHLLMGSVTEKVIRHAPCPVLSIRPVAREKKIGRASCRERVYVLV